MFWEITSIEFCSGVVAKDASTAEEGDGIGVSV
jgi:hypothetical protein